MFPDDHHRNRGGRIGSQPVARLRDRRTRDGHIARSLHFLARCFVSGRPDRVLARIRKGRCTNNERETHTQASDRPTATPAEPAYSYHDQTIHLGPGHDNKNQPLTLARETVPVADALDALSLHRFVGLRPRQVVRKSRRLIAIWHRPPKAAPR